MLTSWSLVSTPAELSMASVFSRTPLSAASMRPSWVRPRLPPSPTTLQRNCAPVTRIASLALSPTSALLSDSARTYVPMPPFHSRSTGACRIACSRSLGVMLFTPSSMPRSLAHLLADGMDFRRPREDPAAGADESGVVVLPSSTATARTAACARRTRRPGPGSGRG